MRDLRSVPGGSLCGKAVTCACGDSSSVRFREPAGAWQWFRFGMDSGFRFGIDSEIQVRMNSGSHRWLSRAQLVGVDLDSRLHNKEVE